MKKSTALLLLALGGFLLMTQSASATMIRPRPIPPAVPPVTAEPIASAD